MSTHLGHKVSENKAAKWARALAPSLLPGEETLALFGCNNMRPMTDAIAVTNFRIGGLTSTGWSVDFPYANRISVEPNVKKETVLVRAEDPATLPYDAHTRRPEMLFKMVHREDHHLLMATVSHAVGAFDLGLYLAGIDQMAIHPPLAATPVRDAMQVQSAEAIAGAAGAGAKQLGETGELERRRRPGAGLDGGGSTSTRGGGQQAAAAGWYPIDEGNLRYWDGVQWTRHIAPTTTRQGSGYAASPTPVADSSAPEPASATPTKVASWLGWGGLCLMALLGVTTSGVSGFFALSGAYLFVVAVIALIRGRVGWAHLRTRAAGATALGAAVALTIVGGATASPTDQTPAAAPASSSAPTPTLTPSATPTLTRSAAPTPTPSATKVALTPATAAKGTALAAVASLTVKGRAPKTGYSKDKFGQAWFDTDRNGCDTRNDILRRDLVDRDMKNSCKVLAGTRAPDPYTGTTVRFVLGGTSEIDIDHVVALSDAWQKGAAKWSAGKRLAFANDPLTLLAVDAGANRAKGDGDVATWLPPNKSYRCEYVARVISVKMKYEVWVTAAERDAMVRVLSNCATTALPQPGPAPTTAALPKSTPKPAPEPAPPPPAPEPEAPSSVYYANCDAVRAAGAAPIYRGDPGYSSKLDRDGDGVACE